MKVLITTDWYKPAINGVVTSVCNLREELQQRGHEVKILTLSRTARCYEEEGVIYMGSVNAGYIIREQDFGCPRDANCIAGL